MSPRMHEREKVVNAARTSLAEKLLDWLQEDGTGDLTNAEYLAVVTAELSNAVQQRTKMMIRFERHGDFDTPGGRSMRAAPTAPARAVTTTSWPRTAATARGTA